MAQNKTKVLLGFEDELINDKYKNQVNFTTNKIGGKPNFSTNIKLETLVCPLCNLPRPLIVQIYAPLNNLYHRTLYLFGCINPNCWNQSESWTCIRVESQEKITESNKSLTTMEQTKTTFTDWYADADDWDDVLDSNANICEENGNIINNVEKLSDEDDESGSYEEYIKIGFGNLTIDERNANIGGEAMGRLRSPTASAEIEGNEGEVISIDTPIIPQHNIPALLQEVTPLPKEICHTHFSENDKSSIFQFVSYFMNVWEETNNLAFTDGHVKELIQEYQQNNDDFSLNVDCGAAASQLNYDNMESYEKTHPAHGDKMFHNFLMKIQMNPGQILRYNRDIESPLLLYPLEEYPKKCLHCHGELIFEFQLLPTIIPKLQLLTDIGNCPRLEFGTILVFTCRRSCWSTESKFRFETVILQSEIY